MKHVSGTKNTSFEKPRKARKTLFRLFAYLSKQKALLFLVFILILIGVGSGIASSYLLRPIINNYIIPGDMTGLTRILLFLAAVYLTGVIATLLQARILNKVGQRTVADLRKDLFGKMEILPISFFDARQNGELMSRYTNDIDRISEVLTNSITELLTSVLTLVSIIILMIYISPVLTLVTLIIIPVMFFLAAKVIGKSRKYFREQQEAIGKANGYIEEIISGQKVVKVFNHEKNAEADFDILNHDFQEKAQKAQLFSGLMMPLMQNMSMLNFVFITIVGSLLVVFRGFDIGGLAAFLQYSRQFGRPINGLANQYNSLQAAIAGAERIFEILDEIPETVRDKQTISFEKYTIKGNIKLKDVYFNYKRSEPVLKGISIDVPSGRKIALVGSTGAGKTTIFNLLPRFYDVLQGEITVDGIPINNMHKDDLRKIMSIVLQDTHLFTGTVMENIRYGRLDATDEEVVIAAKLSAAHSFIERLPNGYSTILTDDGNNLSRGQRQLLNIARAAIKNSPILLLDEATSNVDTRTEILIQEGMDRIMDGKTSFIIAHRLSTVKNADEIIVLENGQIAERGNHTELLEKKGKYFTLYTGQFS